MNMNFPLDLIYKPIGVVTLRKLIHKFFPNKRFYKRALKTQTWWKDYKSDTNVFYQCVNNSY
jgi:hypothetical protein